MDNDLSCYLCERDFSEANLPRMLPSCLHTYCESCIRKLMKILDSGEVRVVCPQDHSEMEFPDKDLEHFPRNTGLLNLIVSNTNIVVRGPSSLNNRSRRESKGTPQIFQADHCKQFDQIRAETFLNHKYLDPIDPQNPLYTPKKFLNYSNTRSSQQIPSPIPRLYSSQSQILLPSPSVTDFCLIHNKPLDIICIKDHTEICSNCALFGDHRGHEFKTIEQVDKDRITKQRDILNIMDRKQILDSELESREKKEMNSKTLKHKYELLVQEVKCKYSRLRAILDEQEKRSLDRLGSFYKTVEDKVQMQAKSIITPLQDYSKWQLRAMKVIDELQASDNYSRQILILNYEKNSAIPDIVEEGLNIVATIQETEREISEFRQTTLDQISLHFNDHLEQDIRQYFSISNRQEKSATIETNNTKASQSQRALLLPATSHDELLLDNTTSREESSFLQQGKYNGLNGTCGEVEFSPFTLNISVIGPEPLHGQHKIIKVGSKNHLHPSSSSYLHNSPTRLSSSPDRSGTASKRYSGGIKESRSPRRIDAGFNPYFSSGTLQSPKTADSWQKKKQRLNLPAKYEKLIEGVMNESAEQLDLTGAELGDLMVMGLLQMLRGKKLVSLKLIRNKLTDDVVYNMWELLGSVVTLNLSQNNFTDRVLESFLLNRQKVPQLRNLVLSQNKVNQRNCKSVVQEIRRLGVIISL